MDLNLRGEKMAQRRRVENPVVDVSNDEALNFFFQKAAGELTKLYSLALDRHVAFDAGTRYAYMIVYEWIQLQLQNGISVTAADISAYLQDKLNELDSNMLNSQQQVEIEESANEVLLENDMHNEIEESANEVLLENDMHNAHQLPEQLAHGTQSGASGDTNGNPFASQVQEMEIN